MARKATREFEDRTFVGARVALALQALRIPQEKFLRAYDEVQTPRKQMSDKLAAMEAQLAELRNKLQSQSQHA